MKKYINSVFLFLIATILFSSCKKDLLELYPIDAVSNVTYWNTENDLATYNNGLYNQTTNNDNVPILWGHSTGNDNNSIFFQDGYTDNMASTVGYFAAIRSGSILVPAAPQTFGYKGWGFVRAINVGLENYNTAKIAQAVIDKYIGEARLFRGWFYAEKVEKFGDVPWVERSLNIDAPELYAPRMSRDSAMDKILADLNFASTKLPDSWADGNAPGRINRWGALLVKARVCLYEGTWRKYRGLPNATKWLTEAANASKELIDKGPYTLHQTGDVNNDYSSFQRALNLAGNKEVMYWKKYQTGVLNCNVQASYARTMFGSTKSFVEDFLCTDGLPINLSPLYKGDDKIEDVFINRDPRLRQCILHPADSKILGYDTVNTYPRFPGMPAGLMTTTGGYHVVKHFNPAYIGQAFNTGETPAIVLRFGEALLTYAEAQAELGLITQADLDLSINKLRTRVGMPKMVLTNIPVDSRYTADGVSPLIVEIRRERRIELFNEGFRYNDLKRWKQGKKLEQITLGIQWNAAAKARYVGASIKTLVDPVSGKTYIEVYQGTVYAKPIFDESKHYLWPIPLSSLAENPNIKQNPGY